MNWTPGTEVEVYKVWASSASEGPLMDWMKGYKFVRLQKKEIVVTPIRGVFAGEEIAYNMEDVRERKN